MMTTIDIEEEAAAWVLRVGDPDCTVEELAALDSWLDQDPEHRQKFNELHALWYHADFRLENVEPVSAEQIERVVEAAVAYKGVVRAYHQRYAADIDDARRLVGETYGYLAASPLSDLTDVHSVRESLLTHARAVALRRLRQQEIVPLESLAEIETLERVDTHKQVQTIVGADWILSALEAAFNSLPSRCRSVLLLYKIYGYTCEEVSLRLGINESTVKKHLKSAMCHVAVALSHCDTAAYGKPSLSIAPTKGRRRGSPFDQWVRESLISKATGKQSGSA